MNTRPGTPSPNSCCCSREAASERGRGAHQDEPAPGGPDDADGGPAGTGVRDDGPGAACHAAAADDERSRPVASLLQIGAILVSGALLLLVDRSGRRRKLDRGVLDHLDPVRRRAARDVAVARHPARDGALARRRTTRRRCCCWCSSSSSSWPRCTSRSSYRASGGRSRASSRRWRSWISDCGRRRGTEHPTHSPDSWLASRSIQPSCSHARYGIDWSR